MKRYTLLTLCILLGFLACQEETLSPIPTNDNLIFKNTSLLPIELTFDQSNTPIFSVEAVSNELIYIAISNEQLTTDELEVQNQDAIIWHWHSGINNNKFIGVEDGSFLDSIALKQKNVSCQLSLYDQLYWAAWAWDEEGIKITHSTESQLLDTDIQQEINFTINKVSTTDSDGDTFLKAGELITYKVTLDYKGTFPLNDLVATLSSSSIVELPITIQVDSTITDKVDLNYTFTLPDNAVFKEEIPLKLELAFNDCFTQALDLNVATTGRNVCLLSMTLKKIYTNPPGNYWDDICGFVPYPEAFRNPDPCYTLTSESIPNIYSNCPSETSGELEDVDPRCPDAQWLALSPCAPLALNEFHTVRVLDENAPWCEDNEFIGQIGFYPRDFLDSTLTFQIVTSETIQIGLELAWE